MAVSELKKLLEILQQTRQQLENVTILPSAKTELDMIIAHAQEPISIMVMGEFSTGKSTFINALVGQEVAAMNVTQTTAVITKLCYGDTDRTTVYFRDGRCQEYQAEDFAKLTAETKDETIGSMHKDIDYVERQIPNDILKWVTIIDSPGLNATEKRHIEATNRFVKKADTVIWMYKAEQAEVKRTELIAMESLSARLKPIAVINKMDMIDEEEDDPEEILDGFRKQLGDKVQAVVGLSAKFALEGKLHENDALLKESNIGELDHVMRTLVKPKRDEYKINSLLDELGIYCYHVFSKLGEKKEALQKNSTVDMQAKTVLLLAEAIFFTLGNALKNLSEVYAEQANNAQALFLLATLKYWGIGAEKNEAEALTLLEYAAIKNNAAAQIWLSELYAAHGNWEKAMEWYLHLAERGELDAQWAVAMEYFHGEHVPKDQTQAFEWFRKLAAKGDPRGQFMLAECYDNGIAAECDEEKAFGWYYKAAKQGHADAQLAVAAYYLSRNQSEKDQKKTVYWMTKAAQQGHAEAQTLLGLCYIKEFGTQLNEKQAFYWFKQAAKQGDIEAQSWLGRCYLNGIGTKEDDSKAFYWHQKAAEQGNAFSQNSLGNLYRQGIGTAMNREQAFYWYQKAAEQGNANAKVSVAVLYMRGEGVVQDEDRAFCMFEELADEGNADAQFWMGYCYEQSIATEQKPNLAFAWYRKAAEQGEPTAQWNVGDCYYYGWGTSRDYTAAVEWYTKSAEQNNIRAKYRLACCNEKGQGTAQNWDKAAILFLEAAEEGYGAAQLWMAQHVNKESEQVEWLTKSANTGNVDAQYYLALRYKSGNGVPMNPSQAVYWLMKAAEDGHANAQYELADCYADGSGVGQDKNKAVYWLKKAAEQGGAKAQAALGLCYAEGIGVSQDNSSAAYWFREAANQGNSKGQAGIGACYLNGIGVAKDYNMAFHWLTKAANKGDSEGQFFLGVCYRDGFGVEKNIDNAILWFEQAAAQGDKDAKECLKNIRKAKKESEFGCGGCLTVVVIWCALTSALGPIGFVIGGIILFFLLAKD